MDEQQILKQLNELKEETKPRESWVNLTKQELFEDEQQQSTAATLIGKAFAPLERPALALAAIGLLAMVLSGGMFYSPQLVKIDEPMPDISNDSLLAQQQEEELTASLQGLEQRLDEVNTNLSQVKDSENVQSLAKLAAIQATAEHIQGQVQTLASKATNSETASAFDQIKVKSNQVIEATQGMQKETVKTLINELESNQQLLSDKNKERLEKAKQNYQEEKYDKAFLSLRPMLQEQE